MAKISGLLFLLLSFLHSSAQPFEKSENKLMYRLVETGDGRVAEMGDLVTVTGGIYLNDSAIFHTDFGKAYLEITVVEPGYKGDPSELWTLVRSGDSIECKIPTNTYWPRVLGQNRPKEVPSDGTVYYRFRVQKVQSPEEVIEERLAKREEARLNEGSRLLRFLEQSNIDTNATIRGVYVQYLEQGVGSRATRGKTVEVSYRGYLLDGTLFDESLPAEPFTFEVGAGQVIEGWDSTLPDLREGDEVVLVIPSGLAYGPMGVPGTPIGPFEPLVFQMKIEAVYITE